MLVLALTMCAAIIATKPTEPAAGTAMLDWAQTTSEFITVQASVLMAIRIGHDSRITARRGALPTFTC
jgi:hypothetical protein